MCSALDPDKGTQLGGDLSVCNIVTRPSDASSLLGGLALRAARSPLTLDARRSAPLSRRFAPRRARAPRSAQRAARCALRAARCALRARPWRFAHRHSAPLFGMLPVLRFCRNFISHRVPCNFDHMPICFLESGLDPEQQGDPGCAKEHPSHELTIQSIYQIRRAALQSSREKRM